MKRIVKPPQYMNNHIAVDEASRQQQWINRARRFDSTNEAEDWSFLRLFFPDSYEINEGQNLIATSGGVKLRDTESSAYK